MTYQQFRTKAHCAGFTRVERDDRLLDVFPDQTRNKGIELWERWGDKEVHLLQLRLPFDQPRIHLISLPRTTIEKYLSQNKTAHLSDCKTITVGDPRTFNFSL